LQGGELYPDDGPLTASRSACDGGVYGKFAAVRPLRPGRKNFVALFVVAIAIFAAWNSQRRGADPAKQATPEDQGKIPLPTAKPRPASAPAGSGAATASPGRNFDFYLLAMTAHPAFCADGHAREPECRLPAAPLSIHGLWPEKLAPGKYPRDCQGPPLSLDHGLELELAPLMPGMADDLHEHEWRAHGRCSGLDDDDYFRATLELARRVDGVLRAKLTTLAGDTTNARELREYADSYESGLGTTLTFHCRTLRDAPAAHRREPYLVEIRQCVDDDGARGAPGTLLDCATVGRRDQGCGSGFRIAR
jgi:ribonuclease T2